MQRPPKKAGSFAEGAELLESFEATDFTAAERLIALFVRQPFTNSGFPRVRPSDCSRITDALEKVLIDNADLFRMGDPSIAEQFDRIIAAYLKTEVRSYDGEFQRVLTLHARMKLLRSDAAGAQAIVGPLAARPYTIQTGFFGMMDILSIDLQCKSALGDIDGCAKAAMQNVKLLVSLRPGQAWYIGWRFANFISLRGKTTRSASVIEAICHFWADAISRAHRKGVAFVVDPLLSERKNDVTVSQKIASFKAHVFAGFLGWNLYLLRFGDIPLRSSGGTGGATKDIVVTRAMGGIGDLLMMTPGLRALSRRYGQPIKMAIPVKFFSVFANLPHVELVDIDGPPIEMENVRRWFNLTICPASAYEAPNSPFIKKGRVELFARGIGVKARMLKQVGQRIDIKLSDEERAFCEEFKTQHQFGARPLIGVQPFSREEYRNYPGMDAVVQELARTHDILIFHHRSDGLPSGPGIYTTAGLSLRKSFALMSMLDVLISVDSSFLHGASAFDIPVVALFGPIDGAIRTRHLDRVKVISLDKQFPCSPCWRNEDEPCLVTRNVGASPCLSAIPRSIVIDAVQAFLESAPQRNDIR